MPAAWRAAAPCPPPLPHRTRPLLPRSRSGAAWRAATEPSCEWGSHPHAALSLHGLRTALCRSQAAAQLPLGARLAPYSWACTDVPPLPASRPRSYWQEKGQDVSIVNAVAGAPRVGRLRLVSAGRLVTGARHHPTPRPPPRRPSSHSCSHRQLHARGDVSQPVQHHPRRAGMSASSALAAAQVSRPAAQPQFWSASAPPFGMFELSLNNTAQRCSKVLAQAACAACVVQGRLFGGQSLGIGRIAPVGLEGVVG